ncbi:MAG: SDR family oxidoreductase [Nitrospinae bacterium]|nr:SDR family oxidoreductase [Nitrospinota bacterium]
MSFLNLEGKTFLVVGVANKKSVAAHIARTLVAEGASVVFSAQDEAKADAIRKMFGAQTPVFVCDVADKGQVVGLVRQVGEVAPLLHGLVHSVAFANYSRGLVPFHEVEKEDFLQALDISCFSLVTLCNACRPLLAKDASVVTISISTTTMAAENYGYMAPIKAALDSTVVFLTKSFSPFSEVRFNAVAPGLLKTSASAGIPGYVDSYLYAEKVIPRGRAVTTEEAANVAVFLLSPASAGMTAQKLVVDAGMAINYFDRRLVRPEQERGS